MMNLSQTKLVGLTMELDLRTREYKKLCEKLDKLKADGINPNDESLIELKMMFQKNYNDIVEINKQIRLIKNDIKVINEEAKFETDNIFKSRQIKSNESKEVLPINIEKKSFWKKIYSLIMKFFKR